MSVESSLCRELGIRFIDARMLVNEAKVKMNITGYIDRGLQLYILEEAIRIFEEKDSAAQREMRRAHWMLEALKNPKSPSDWKIESSSHTDHTTHSEISAHNERNSRLVRIFGRYR